MFGLEEAPQKVGIFRQGRFLHLVLIIIVGVIAYSNTLNVPFYFDDARVIYENPLVKDLGYYLHPSKVADVDMAYKDNIKSMMNTRYVGFLTFALNYKSGGMNVRGFHIVNIAIHAINGLLLYSLVIWLFRTPKLSADPMAKYADWVALFASLLFIVHPIQTQAVTYIVQRFTSLATLFYLSAMLFYLKARIDKRNLFLILSLVSAILALNTKEIAFTIPFTAALIEWLFFDGTMKEKLKPIAPYFVITALAGVWMIAGELDAGGYGLSMKLQTGMSRIDYLYTETTVLARYLRLAVYPANQTLDYDWPVYNSIWNYNVLASAGLLSACFIAGVWSIKRTSLRLVSFGIFWFFTAHIVESGAMPIADVIFEHRMYLPSAGLFIAFAGLAAYLYEKKYFRGVFVELSVLILVLLLSATISRNKLWNDEIAFWRDNVLNAPNKPRVHLHLANVYAKYNMLEEAVGEYENVIRLDPESVDALTKTGILHDKLGMYGKAMEFYMKALEVNKNSATALNNVAMSYTKLKEYGKATEYFKRAITMNPKHCPAHYNYGALLMTLGDLDGAITEFKTALKINPDYLLARKSLAYIYFDRGDISNAIVEFEEAVRLDPSDMESRQKLESIKR